jgi:hypothetical protein
MSLAGYPRTKIASLRISRSTVQYTLEQYSIRNDTETGPRAGSPLKISTRSSALVLRLIKTNPFISYGDIRIQTQLKCIKLYDPPNARPLWIWALESQEQTSAANSKPW